MSDAFTLRAQIADRASASDRPAIDLDLDAMQALLAALDNPHERLPAVVHVAGTNGKGSVIALLAAILAAAGKRIVAYTSPWTAHPRESLWQLEEENLAPATTAGPRLLDEQSYDNLLARVADASRADASLPPTAFEAETAAAFLYAAESGADIFLLETGMGGRLDATNVVDTPLLTIITPVALDHQHFLGTSREAIASEKAGIIKPGMPVIIAPQEPDAFAPLEQAARHANAPMIAAGRDWDAFEQHGRLIFQSGDTLRDLVLPALDGRHQIANAGTAIAAADRALRELDSRTIDDATLERGLAAVRWPCRLERLSTLERGLCVPETFEIWVDGGHNAAAAEALAHALADMDDAAAKPIYLIVGMLQSKDADIFLRPFRGLVRTVAAVSVGKAAHLTAPPMRRSEIVGAAEAIGIEAHAMSGIEGAVRWIVDQGESEGRIVICGSLHLATAINAIPLDDSEKPGTSAGL
ncbi:MAG: Mur ligase family protein [Pseudomonadota bacterium]